MESFVQMLALSDVVGIGTYREEDGGGDRIDNITYWLGNPGTNSVLLTPIDWLDGGLFSWDVEPNDIGVFWGMRLGWNSLPSNEVILAKSSAWARRTKLTQADSAECVPLQPFRFSGDWINVTTNSPATVNFISNVVQSLCVSPNLIQYSEALIPPLNVKDGNELFLFKADAFMEMLKLLGREDEDFLVHVLNSPQYPGKYRGSALFQLKKRFDWPATNTVPVP